METLLTNHVTKEELEESYSNSYWDILVDSHLKEYKDRIELIIDSEDLNWEDLTIAANKLIDNPNIDVLDVEDVCKMVLSDLVYQDSRNRKESWFPEFELV